MSVFRIASDPCQTVWRRRSTVVLNFSQHIFGGDLLSQRVVAASSLSLRPSHVCGVRFVFSSATLNSSISAAASITSDVAMPSALPLPKAVVPRAQDERDLRLLVADGRTPRSAVVIAIKDYGLLVRLVDSECQGIVPRHGVGTNRVGEDEQLVEGLRIGDTTTVYVLCKRKDTGRLTFALRPSVAPIIQLPNVVSDGRMPYPGIVTSVTASGVFVDFGCESQGLVPARQVMTEQAARGSPFVVGDPVVVYVTDKDCRRSRCNLSFTPLSNPRTFWKHARPDGYTPYQGVVSDVDSSSIYVDIGVGVPGVVSRKDRLRVECGQLLTVYIVGKDMYSQQLKLSLVRHALPLTPLEQIIADGQTPYQATVLKRLAGAGYILDVGCEKCAFLADSDPRCAGGRLRIGESLLVFVEVRCFGRRPLNVTTLRRSTPRERLAAVAADGVTPYVGTVLSITELGLFVDIGCEVTALMLARDISDSSKVPPVGQQVVVYVWTRSPEVGKVYVRLEPREAPGLAFEDVEADGVTPRRGVVVRQTDAGAFVDVGCDNLALLKRKDSRNDSEAVGALPVGATVQVYVVRRNPVTHNMALALEPDAKPRFRLEEVVGGGYGMYDGYVCQTLHGTAFVDFHCEVSGFLPLEDIDGLAIGDRVRVRPVAYDSSQGRWRVQLDSAI